MLAETWGAELGKDLDQAVTEIDVASLPPDPDLEAERNFVGEADVERLGYFIVEFLQEPGFELRLFRLREENLDTMLLSAVAEPELTISSSIILARNSRSSRKGFTFCSTTDPRRPFSSRSSTLIKSFGPPYRDRRSSACEGFRPPASPPPDPLGFLFRGCNDFS